MAVVRADLGAGVATGEAEGTGVDPADADGGAVGGTAGAQAATMNRTRHDAANHFIRHLAVADAHHLAEPGGASGSRARAMRFAGGMATLRGPLGPPWDDE